MQLILETEKNLNLEMTSFTEDTAMERSSHKSVIDPVSKDDITNGLKSKNVKNIKSTGQYSTNLKHKEESNAHSGTPNEGEIYNDIKIRNVEKIKDDSRMQHEKVNNNNSELRDSKEITNDLEVQIKDHENKNNNSKDTCPEKVDNSNLKDIKIEKLLPDLDGIRLDKKANKITIESNNFQSKDNFSLDVSDSTSESKDTTVRSVNNLDETTVVDKTLGSAHLLVATSLEDSETNVMSKEVKESTLKTNSLVINLDETVKERKKVIVDSKNEKNPEDIRESACIPENVIAPISHGKNTDSVVGSRDVTEGDDIPVNDAKLSLKCEVTNGFSSEDLPDNHTEDSAIFNAKTNKDIITSKNDGKKETLEETKDLVTTMQDIETKLAEVSDLIETKTNDQKCHNPTTSDDKDTRNVVNSNEHLLSSDEVLHISETPETLQETLNILSETDVMEVDDTNDNDKKQSCSKDENTYDTNQLNEVNIDMSETSRKDSSKKFSPVLKLSNNLNILSDDEDEPGTEKPKVDEKEDTDKQCINLEDDDDIMVIDDNTAVISKSEKNETKIKKDDKEDNTTTAANGFADDKATSPIELPLTETLDVAETKKDTTIELTEIQDKIDEPNKVIPAVEKPLVPENFLTSCKKNLKEMTRDDLEELCILKIVESIVDRSNLSEIKNKLKTITQTLDDFKKKTTVLFKQNRDLQVVLKSVQEEQKKGDNSPITPLKITRSVGMQVLMADNVQARRKPPTNFTSSANIKTPTKNVVPQTSRPTRQNVTNQANIPVPRLVPAGASPINSQTNTNNFTVKSAPPTPNGVRNSPVQKTVEKRPLNKSQSVTVDLTDDEPPAKAARTSLPPTPPYRLIPPHNIVSPSRPQFNQNANNLRKVYIPISGPQAQSVRPSPPIAVKNIPQNNSPKRSQSISGRATSNSVGKTDAPLRHPAPLPDTLRQYQRPNWKGLPPAPDLKLSKVENGIVISWKIEGYDERIHEEIASYQLYAYQETNQPPNTQLWKKIGDVKALPLPMACTLTQFIAGHKYYFAVRAVDVRSRLGKFSLPGSILLLHKI